MKRSLTLLFSGMVAFTAFAAQAQNMHGDSHDNGHQKSSAHSHASRDHGSFKANGKSHDYRAGERLPSQYRSKSHYVDNYSQYHLRKPPAGHRWVRDDGGNFVLIAVTTGLITQILSGN